jgi:hypothetical protein
MSHLTMTDKLAIAIGQDAGNAAMRAAGRTAWNEDDWSLAAETTARLLAAVPDQSSCLADS